jgi:hypothetical protein
MEFTRTEIHGSGVWCLELAETFRKNYKAPINQYSKAYSIQCECVIAISKKGGNGGLKKDYTVLKCLEIFVVCSHDLERFMDQSKYKQEAQGPHRSPESYWLIFCT